MEDRETALIRRQIVGVLLLAAEQAPKVLQVCGEASGDDESLVRALAEAFHISEFEAGFIPDMQVRRFTPRAIEQLRTELTDIDRMLADHTRA